AEQKARANETKARQQAFVALRSIVAQVVERKFAQGVVLTEDDRAFLRGIIAQFDAFAAIKANDAASRLARAEGRLRVGNMRCTLGEFKEAEKDYHQALALYKPLAADFPERPEFQQMVAHSHHSLGVLLQTTDRPTDAEAAYREAWPSGSSWPPG